MGYRKLGVAFCAGLQPEAMAFTKILEAQCFEAATESPRMMRVLINKGYQSISGAIEGEKLAEAAPGECSTCGMYSLFLQAVACSTGRLCGEIVF